MKYKVTYFVVDRGDNNNRYDAEIESPDRAGVHKQLRKKHKGCHIHSITIKPVETGEDNVVEVKRCPTCNKQLTDGGQCPVCDLGDEEEREGHQIFEGNKVLKEARDTAAIMAQVDKDKKAGVQLDPLNPDDIEAVADEHGYDDEETAIYKKHYFGEGASTVSVDKFWGLVCSGRDDEIFKICSDDRDPKQYYNRFGSDHSYIMGAIRNGNYSTAKILMTFGHKILEHESYEVLAELLKAKGIK